MRTRVAKPVMAYAVDSAGRIRRCAILVCCNRIGAKAEELAAAGPMKLRRTRRVCAFRMLPLIERRSLQRSNACCRMRIGNPGNRGPQFFQALNDGSQPVSDGLFGLAGVAVAVERIQRFSRGVERNVAAGYFG